MAKFLGRLPGVPQKLAWKIATPVFLTASGFFAVVNVVAVRGAGESAAAFTARDFYGVLKVQEVTTSQGQVRRLMNGRILHGAQFVGAGLRTRATTYYGASTGVGVAVNRHPRRVAAAPLEVAVVGLGVGTVMVHCRESDRFTLFELSPLVASLANTEFTFLQDAPCAQRVVLGDGRVSLGSAVRQEPALRFDVIVLDAFSGDAIPVHLLTTEAFSLYRRALNPDGVLAVHVSNKFLDLTSVVADLASLIGLQSHLVTTRGETDALGAPSVWVLAVPEAVASEMLQGVATTALLSRGAPWTDRFSNLWSVIKW